MLLGGRVGHVATLGGFHGNRIVNAALDNHGSRQPGTRQNDREFVATQPEHGVAPPYRLA